MNHLRVNVDLTSAHIEIENKYIFLFFFFTLMMCLLPLRMVWTLWHSLFHIFHTLSLSHSFDLASLLIYVYFVIVIAIAIVTFRHFSCSFSIFYVFLRLCSASNDVRMYCTRSFVHARIEHAFVLRVCQHVYTILAGASSRIVVISFFEMKKKKKKRITCMSVSQMRRSLLSTRPPFSRIFANKRNDFLLCLYGDRKNRARQARAQAFATIVISWIKWDEQQQQEQQDKTKKKNATEKDERHNSRV